MNTTTDPKSPPVAPLRSGDLFCLRFLTMKTPRTFNQTYVLTEAEAEMLTMPKTTREIVPASLAKELETQLSQWVEAANASQQPQAFYDGYSEAQMRAMQAMLTKANAHAHNLADQLAECAGVLASVDTERRFRDMHGNLWISQTLDWCKGAKAIGAKANALLETHDNLSEQNLQAEPRSADLPQP